MRLVYFQKKNHKYKIKFKTLKKVILMLTLQKNTKKQYKPKEPQLKNEEKNNDHDGSEYRGRFLWYGVNTNQTVFQPQKSHIFTQASLVGTEFIIKIKIENENENENDNPKKEKTPSCFQYSIDKTECTESYAILMALTDYFTTESVKDQTDPPRHYIIHAKDLLLFNILNDYIWKWRSNNWVMSQGNIASYPDILDNLCNTLIKHKISYETVKDK